MKRLCKLGVLEPQPESEWALSTFIILKKNKTMRFLTNFREVKKCVIRKPYPIPKIIFVLQELDGFTFATSLDLNMGYYILRIDRNAQKICTLILPWGKYSYLHLPIGMTRLPGFFPDEDVFTNENPRVHTCVPG